MNFFLLTVLLLILLGFLLGFSYHLLITRDLCLSLQFLGFWILEFLIDWLIGLINYLCLTMVAGNSWQCGKEVVVVSSLYSSWFHKKVSNFYSYRWCLFWRFTDLLHQIKDILFYSYFAKSFNVSGYRISLDNFLLLWV